MNKNAEIIAINKEVWIPEIKKSIVGWLDFSKSIFCEEAEDKQSAIDSAYKLMEMLDLVESDRLTRKQFEELRLLVH